MIDALAIVLILLAGIFLYFYTAKPKLSPETDAIIDHVLSSELPEIIAGKTGWASSDGLSIWYECISPERAPKGTVLLVMGNGADALFWPPKFVH